MVDELGEAFDVIGVAGFGSCALPKVQDGGQVACPGVADRCHSPNLPRRTTAGSSQAGACVPLRDTFVANRFAGRRPQPARVPEPVRPGSNRVELSCL